AATCTPSRPLVQAIPAVGARDDIRSVTLVRRLAVAMLAALAVCAAAAAATGDPQYQLSPADQSWTGGIILGAEDIGGGWKGYGTPGGITGADSGASASC